MNKRFLALVLACVILSCNNEKMEEIVVIGGGLMGSAAGWQLAHSGAPILLLEQQDSVYSYGSSFGDSRISRSLGPPGDLFSYLQQTSVAETHKLIAFLNNNLTGGSHSMEDIYTTSPITYIFQDSQDELISELLNGQTDPYDYASTPSEALSLFGMYIPDSLRIIRESRQYSGTLDPAELIAKLQQGITLSGSHILYNEKVVSLQRVADHYRIESINQKTGETRIITARKIVVAAGPYTGGLLRDLAPDFARVITTKRLFLAFFIPTFWAGISNAEKERFTASFPVAEMDAEIFYAMVDSYDEEGIPVIKVGGHFLRTDIADLDAVWELPVTETEQEWAASHLLNYLSVLGFGEASTALDFYKGYSCVYSLTATEVPYVARIPTEIDAPDPDAVVIAGLSGVGAKGALAYGLLATDLLLGRENPDMGYQKARRALGDARLLKDLTVLKERNTTTSEDKRASVKDMQGPSHADGGIFFRRNW